MNDKENLMFRVKEACKKLYPDAVSVSIFISSEEVEVKPCYKGELNGFSMQTLDGGWCTHDESAIAY